MPFCKEQVLEDLTKVKWPLKCFINNCKSKVVNLNLYWTDLDVSDEIFKAGVYHIVLRRRWRGGVSVAVHGRVGADPASAPAGDGCLHQPVAIHEVRCFRLLRDDVRLRPGIQFGHCFILMSDFAILLMFCSKFAKLHLSNGLGIRNILYPQFLVIYQSSISVFVQLLIPEPNVHC